MTDPIFRLGPQQAKELTQALEKEFQIDAPTLMKAAAADDMFQALDRNTFIKVDFHVGEEVPDELSRSQRVEIVQGLELNVPCIEDAIASKLHWIRLGSHRSREDVVGMFQSTQPIDRALLDRICESMGLGELLREMLDTSGLQ